MVKTGTRHRFTGLNRWQRHSVTLAVAPAIVLFVFMFLLIEIFQPELSDVIIRSSDEATNRRADSLGRVAVPRAGGHVRLPW